MIVWFLDIGFADTVTVEVLVAVLVVLYSIYVVLCVVVLREMAGSSPYAVVHAPADMSVLHDVDTLYRSCGLAWTKFRHRIIRIIASKGAIVLIFFYTLTDQLIGTMRSWRETIEGDNIL